MKLLIKILLYVFIALITNVKAINAANIFIEIQKATTSFSFLDEIPTSAFKAIENELDNCCQNEQDLVDYRNWVLGVREVVATKGGMKAIEAGSYTFTKTAAKHLSSRPYMNSPSTITNIMKSGKGVPDATFKGGVNYKVPGTFNGSQGVWVMDRLGW